MKEEFTRPEQRPMLNLEKSDPSLGQPGDIVIRTPTTLVEVMLYRR